MSVKRMCSTPTWFALGLLGCALSHQARLPSLVNELPAPVGDSTYTDVGCASFDYDETRTYEANIEGRVLRFAAATPDEEIVGVMFVTSDGEEIGLRQFGWFSQWARSAEPTRWQTGMNRCHAGGPERCELYGLRHEMCRERARERDLAEGEIERYCDEQVRVAVELCMDSDDDTLDMCSSPTAAAEDLLRADECRGGPAARAHWSVREVFLDSFQQPQAFTVCRVRWDFVDGSVFDNGC